MKAWACKRYAAHWELHIQTGSWVGGGLSLTFHVWRHPAGPDKMHQYVFKVIFCRIQGGMEEGEEDSLVTIVEAEGE